MTWGLPKNLVGGLAAGVAVVIVAWAFAPADTRPFYAAAAQIVPVFLVAVALERSLTEILGSETSVTNEQLARVEREWTPPSSMMRRYYGVGFQLRELSGRSFAWSDIVGARRRLRDLSEADVARSLPPGEQLDRESLDRLTLMLASRVVSGGSRLRARTRRVTRDELLAEWDKLNGALFDRGKERAKEEVRLDVGLAYAARKRRERLSLLTSVVTLAVAEALAFVGLLSPGHPYAGLFSATAGAITGSFVAITMNAVTTFLAREVDVQSAGLDWSNEPVGSHWDYL